MTEAWLIRLLALACLGFAATCGVFWGRRRGYARQVAKLHTDIVESAEAAAFGERVSLSGTPPELGELGSTVNLLFDALESKDAQMRQRETLFHDLANTLPDLVLVHRERIIFANRVTSEPLGIKSDQLVGRTRCDHIVVFNGACSDIGTLVRVQISGVTALTLHGELRGTAAPSDPHSIPVTLGTAGLSTNP